MGLLIMVGAEEVQELVAPLATNLQQPHRSLPLASPPALPTPTTTNTSSLYLHPYRTPFSHLQGHHTLIAFLTRA
jgi:hypothetical protein